MMIDSRIKCNAVKYVTWLEVHAPFPTGFLDISNFVYFLNKNKNVYI